MWQIYIVITIISCASSLLLKAKEVQDDLIKTREELQNVMVSPVAAPMAAPVLAAMEVPSERLENDHEDHEENSSTYSAELLVDGIEDHRNEEERITEAEKNERVQRQLMVTYAYMHIHTFQF